MLDINELRQSLGAVQPAEIAALLDRLEAAERDRATFITEIGNLCAKIEAMERQEPACEVVGQVCNVLYEVRSLKYHLLAGSKLYALPGANSVPDSWLRAVDEALVVTHIGVANADDSYEDAKRKLNELICWHTDVATDPAVNGGFKLVPIEPTEEMMLAAEQAEDAFQDAEEGVWLGVKSYYRAMLAAAPETKP